MLVQGTFFLALNSVSSHVDKSLRVLPIHDPDLVSQTLHRTVVLLPFTGTLLRENSLGLRRASILVVGTCIRSALQVLRGFEISILLALGMKVYSADCALALIEADVVEAFKTCSTYGSYPVIWYKKVLLPPHKHVLPLRQTLNMQVAFARLFLKWTEGIEFSPVLEINFIGRAPVFMLCEKRIF
jgi:hypothetical protein